MKKNILILIVVIVVLWIAFSIFGGAQAPLEDGLYLSYDCGESTISVTFDEIGKNQYQKKFFPKKKRGKLNKPPTR